MGAKAATKDTMDAVMYLAREHCYITERSACDTLLKLWTYMPKEDTLNVLISVLQGSHNDNLKCAACKALKVVVNGPMSEELVDLLIILLSSKKDDVKKAAVEVFRSLDETCATVDTVNALIDASQDYGECLRWTIRDVLSGIYEKTTSPHIISAILQRLRSSDKQVRDLVRMIFEWSDAKTASDGAIDTIVEIYRDSDENTRRMMREAFSRMKMPATTKDFMNSIIEVFRDPDEDVRQLAFERLLKMNKEMVTKDLVDMLIETMQYADWPLREAVAEIFGRWQFVKFDSDQINNILNPTGEVSEASLTVLLMSESSWGDLSEQHIVQLRNGVLSKPFFAYEHIPANKLMQIWLADPRGEWIPLLVHSALVQSTAIVRIENDVILYNVRSEAIRQPVDEQKWSCFLQSVCQYLTEIGLSIPNSN